MIKLMMKNDTSSMLFDDALESLREIAMLGSGNP